jgi:threonine dehydrogenase-like Zn-dependent dehydrogenase
MRACVLHDFGDLRVEEVPDPVPGPGEVVIDVACVQLSVTECALLAGEDVYGHAAVSERLDRDGPQRLLGHEFCGRVRELGAGVEGLEVGDLVTSIELIPCGRCTACRNGFRFECPSYEVLGFHRPGALAERLLVPAEVVVRLPDALSIQEGAALQPLSAAVMAHTVAQVRPGESVAVIGGGVMGLLAVQLARIGNAGLVALTTRDPRKLELARELGADVVVSAVDGDATAAVAEATGGLGADVVFETAGGATSLGLSGTATLDQAVEMVRRGGRIVEVGVLPARAEAPLGAMREKYVTFLNPPSGIRRHTPVEHTLDWAARLVVDGRVDLTSLITHELEGLDAVPEAIRITVDKASSGAINPAQILLGAASGA